MLIVGRLMSLASLLVSFAMFVGTAEGDEFIANEPLLKNEYVAHTDAVLRLWNKKELDFEKWGFEKKFFNQLQDRQKKAPGGYEDDQWHSKMVANWNELPFVLKPEKQLTVGARLTLLGRVTDNVKSLSSGKMSLKDFRTFILGPTYQVLGRAQLKAKESGAVAINASLVSDSIFDWYTMVYPFCPLPDSDENGPKDDGNSEN